MRTFKCDRCGASFKPDKRLPKGKLRYGKDKLRLCFDCNSSYLWWSVSAEIEKEASRKAERELLISLGCGDTDNFNIPAEITDLKYSYLGVEK